jgi:hypothetical protein
LLVLTWSCLMFLLCSSNNSGSRIRPLSMV